MKKTFFGIFCFLLIHIKSSAQKVDNSNYYNYKLTKNVSTNWLRISDVVPIIIDELKKNGVSYHTINVGDLLKVNDTSILVVTVSFSSSQSVLKGTLRNSTHVCNFTNSTKSANYQ